jgi:hypothetical protein
MSGQRFKRPEPDIPSNTAVYRALFLEDKDKKNRRWEIALCDRGNVHLHYGTGSLQILRDDFVDLAVEVQQLANRLNIASQENETQNKKGLLQ